MGNGREGSNPGGAAGVIEYVQPESGESDAVGLLGVGAGDDEQPDGAAERRSRRFAGISRKGVRFRVAFTSDSQYLVKGMSEWVFGWMARGWKKKDGPILNLELWKEAVESVRGHQVSWQWVRGHEGHPQNEYANFLATRAAREQTSSDGLVASKFDEWLAEERAAGRMTIEPQAFPDERALSTRPALPGERAADVHYLSAAWRPRGAV